MRNKEVEQLHCRYFIPLFLFAFQQYIYQYTLLPHSTSGLSLRELKYHLMIASVFFSSMLIWLLISCKM